MRCVVLYLAILYLVLSKDKWVMMVFFLYCTTKLQYYWSLKNLLIDLVSSESCWDPSWLGSSGTMRSEGVGLGLTDWILWHICASGCWGGLVCFDCGPTSLVVVGAVGAEEALLLLVATSSNKFFCSWEGLYVFVFWELLSLSPGWEDCDCHCCGCEYLSW